MSKGILKKVLAVTVLAAGAAVAAVKLIERSGLRRSESKDGEEGFQSCEEGAVDRNYVPLSHEAAEESKEAPETAETAEAEEAETDEAEEAETETAEADDTES